MNCSLAKAFVLSLRRQKSRAAYRNMQRYIARCTVDELRGRGVDLKSRRVLELAAGKGGYSQVLAEASGSFIASDIVKDPFFTDEHPEIPWRRVDVRSRFPFDDDSFDFIYCSSLIEHIADPGEMLREARRVLADSGSMLLSFPPFWSLSMVGGHTFEPFHFLGERTAIYATNRLRNSDITSYATAYGEEGGLSSTSHSGGSRAGANRRVHCGRSVHANEQGEHGPVAGTLGRSIHMARMLLAPVKHRHRMNNRTHQDVTSYRPRGGTSC